MPERIFTGGYFQRGILLQDVRVFTSDIFGSGVEFIGGYRVYGGSGSDEDDFTSVAVDSTDAYFVGMTMTPSGGAGYDGMVIKLSASDLSLSAQKRIHSANGNIIVYDADIDDNYVYICGAGPFVSINGFYDNGVLIGRISKTDLSLTAKAYYTDTGGEIGRGVHVDSSNVYVVGHMFEAQYAFVSKFSLDLSSVSAGYGYGDLDDQFLGVCGDSSYLYAAGRHHISDTNKLAAVAKFSKSDLSLSTGVTIGGSNHSEFVDVCCDDTYLYAVGNTNEQGAGGQDIYVVKMSKSDLSISKQVVIGSSSDEYGTGISVDDSYVYVVAHDENNIFAIKLNKSDLSIASQKVITSTTADFAGKMKLLSSKLYIAGSGGENTGDGLPIILGTSLPSGSYSAGNSRTLDDASLTLSTATLSSSSWTPTQRSATTSLTSPTLTYDDLSMSITSFYQWS